MKNTLGYRPDIDGLRTLAVVPVILFHAGAEWLPGGFAGVDVFFVISGYLISSILIRDVAAGTFSFWRFYERRIRRIVPALLAMSVAAVALFQAVALPDQAQGAAESGVAALFSVSNFYFWRQTGYFATDVAYLPLLHTWSLAVEEQFYLGLPVVLLAMNALRLPVKWTIAAGTIAAFAFGAWWSSVSPSAAYYLLPARAWELGIGAALAAGVAPPVRNAFLKEALTVAGVATILFSMVWIHRGMTFPGVVALIPCAGAAMVIHAGGTSWLARRILSSRPMMQIGLMSYSLYLWHWPVFAALRVRAANAHLDPQIAAAGVVLTFGLAYLSWRYVEGPFRDARTTPGVRFWGPLGAGSAALLALAAASVWTGGFPGRLTEPARAALAAASDIDPLRDPCQKVHDRGACRFGPPGAPITYAVVGDSHASALRAAIEASGLMGEEAGTLYWEAACPLLDGARRLDSTRDARCRAHNEAVWTALSADRTLRTVILAARWPFYTTAALPEDSARPTAWLADDRPADPSPAENAAVVERSLIRTIDRLRAMGKRVVVIGSIPEAGFDVPHAIAMARYAGAPEPKGILRDFAAGRAGAADALIARVAARYADVRFISVWESYCAGAWCTIEHKGVPIYADDDHLSYSGAIATAAPLIGAHRRMP